MRAYLDIETSFRGELTVVGIYRSDSECFRQIVGRLITAESLLDLLEGCYAICTYNGSRFDIPVIRSCLGIDLADLFESCDLMYGCWRNGLYGGLKAVEETLGIPRTLFGTGEDDPRLLWVRYAKYGDEASLKRLLDYNREDTLNLILLERWLEGRDDPSLVEVPVASYGLFM